MKQVGIFGGGVCAAFLALACGSNGPAATSDGGTHDSGKTTGSKDGGGGKTDSGKNRGDSGEGDAGGGKDGKAAGDDTGAGDAATTVHHLLLTAQGSSSSEVVALDLKTKTVDGRVTVSDTEAVTDAHNRAALFLLGQSTDTVWRLDSADPWKLKSSWNVGLTGEPDAGSYSADPYSVVVGGGGFAYVVRYTSNFIDVIADTANVDGGAPTTHIDLSGLLQAKDGDHVVEATAAALDVASHTLYVVLGNIDRTTVMSPNFDLLCTGTVSTVVGIDTTTRQVVSITDGGVNGAIALKGFDPVEGGVIYDAANHRLLIAEAGCTPAMGDAGGGTVQHGIETVDLATGATSIVLQEFSTPGDFPGQITAVSATDVLVSVLYPTPAVYHWDPTSAALGDVIPNAPLPFAYNGAGGILGAVLTPHDGGSSVDVVSVNLTSGQSTTLAHDPFSIDVTYVGAADVWPHP